MTSKPKSQNDYLYQGVWTHELDNLLLSSILREKQLHKFEGTVIPVEFLYEAEATIEEDTCTCVNRDDVYNRLQFLESRYRTFKSLVEHPGTRLDSMSNKVFATEKTWTTILKKNPFAGAYTNNGEPEFKLLQKLFSGEFNVREKSIETIVLSDNTIDLNLFDGEDRGKAHVTGEDVSLKNKHKGKLHPRKLFDESAHHLDRESTNAEEVLAYKRDPIEEFERLEKYHGFNNDPTRTIDSSNSSFCASSKPTLWSRQQ
ncbi:L10-interacting MYB domain-containing protein-like [Salvia divinorum]|uniref:L10-interacting MYB domain-containing protein-like n=1 Tax=Salvia divinorum TaxID=28513 RepID=A0ABD1I2M1_SALDI